MTIEQRLQVLETRNRKLVLTGISFFIGILIAVGVTYSETPAQAQSGTERDVVVANKFAVQDSKGQIVGTLLANEEGGMVILGNSGGKTRLIVGMTPLGPSVSMFGEDGNVRLSISLVKEGPLLCFMNKDSKPRFGIVSIGDQSAITVYDAHHQTRLMMGIESQSPFLQLYSPEGNIITELKTKNGHPRLRMFDDNNTPRVLLTTDQDGPGLYLADENGKVAGN